MAIISHSFNHEHLNLLQVFQINVYKKYMGKIINYILNKSVGELCWGIVSNFVEELSRKVVSVNCHVGELSFSLLR